MNLNEYIASVRSRRIGVIGAGVSNRPLIEALCRGGCDVTVCDKAERSALGAYATELEAMGAKLMLGEGYLDSLDFDLIFRTPGVLPHTPQLAAAKARGVRFGQQPKKLPENFDELFVLWRQKKISNQELARICGMDISVIYRKLRAAGISLKSPADETTCR